MSRQAIVRDGIVENIIELEEGARWSPPAGALVVPDPDFKAIVGGTYTAREGFVPPAAPQVAPMDLAEASARTIIAKADADITQAEVKEIVLYRARKRFY